MFWSLFVDPVVLEHYQLDCPAYDTLPYALATLAAVSLQLQSTVGIVVFIVAAYDPDVLTFSMNVGGWMAWLLAKGTAALVAEPVPVANCNVGYGMPSTALTMLTYYAVFVTTFTVVLRAPQPWYRHTLAALFYGVALASAVLMEYNTALQVLASVLLGTGWAALVTLYVYHAYIVDGLYEYVAHWRVVRWYGLRNRLCRALQSNALTGGRFADAYVDATAFARAEADEAARRRAHRKRHPLLWQP
jgi:hypothetical protein